jgi:hypothetical protein
MNKASKESKEASSKSCKLCNASSFICSSINIAYVMLPTASQECFDILAAKFKMPDGSIKAISYDESTFAFH